MSAKAIESGEGPATDLFLPESPSDEEDEPSLPSDQASDGSTPGKPPQGPQQGPDGSGLDHRDPPTSGDSNFSHYAGNPSHCGGRGTQREASVVHSQGFFLSPGKAAAAVIGGALAVGAVPLVLGAMGFTGTGIAASSLAAKMMSAAAIASGGGVAAGSLVATLQSVGAAGLSMSSNILLGSAGSAIGAWLWRSKKKEPSSPPPGPSTEAEKGSGDDPPGPQDVRSPNDKSSAPPNSSKNHKK
ncbi:interferon alpha-inducible protein 27-like protein 2 isoform X1 [Hippopotamus amphibius kiboko]|uniref:interferon alpha-inducible protein 27-like protein 2 isoform X1 n=1 Tax=Hippopotamus amphibius kiboko TaxID=575201 RepID=UPI002597EE22|nr:interferon alpha-inducible protein 27-like protein 2 isoform X1 [Hippopotamus amphibius kiboko]XP_057589855.1 interferon alpha-inducible protein 27-like protein 2 isoform X1 [Hippopotamus amphibius kiboko]XP_057589856.1 interferon alpha-inducible protein 27-like protein 2 isoform X1 [Hippopotamus amphibius kiboko]XP_057589857.1 interferon alpha-inducible protein 27-like protein 2 isoform X1 [Hippopotamus amphibius kiboko]XP_057589858.1 interferon alpha-inducible protein 27-like protein 2 iso